MAKVSLKKMKNAYERMTKGNLIQSPRQLIFTYSNDTIAEGASTMQIPYGDGEAPAY